MAVLATWAPEDAVLGAVAPLALAAAAGTCLVIHLDDTRGVRGDLTLAGLVSGGPRAADLSPRRRGVAVLANGGVGHDEAREVIDALAGGWPAVVLACPAAPSRPDLTGLVPVMLDSTPGGAAPRGPRVVQRVRRRRTPSDPGVVTLPRVSRATIDGLLDGRLPGPTRWMRAWRAVWGKRWV